MRVHLLTHRAKVHGELDDLEVVWDLRKGGGREGGRKGGREGGGRREEGGREEGGREERREERGREGGEELIKGHNFRCVEMKWSSLEVTMDEVRACDKGQS